MVYPAFKDTVRNGRIQLLDDIERPEEAVLPVTMMEVDSQASLSLGERIAPGLQDILDGHYTRVETSDELASHLDQVFSED